MAAPPLVLQSAHLLVGVQCPARTPGGGEPVRRMPDKAGTHRPLTTRCPSLPEKLLEDRECLICVSYARWDSTYGTTAHFVGLVLFCGYSFPVTAVKK